MEKRELIWNSDATDAKQRPGKSTQEIGKIYRDEGDKRDGEKLYDRW